MNGCNYRVRRERGDDQVANVTVANEQVGSIAGDRELRAGKAYRNLSSHYVRCSVNNEHIARRSSECTIADVSGINF